MNLINVTGIGQKLVEKLATKDIYSVEDLINYYPNSYEYFTSQQLIEGNIVINGTIISKITTYRPRSNLLVTNFFLSFKGEEIKVVAWNQKFLTYSFKELDKVQIEGKYDAKKNQLTLKTIRKNEMKDLADVEIIPLYSRIKGISNQKLIKIISNALLLTDAEEWLKEIHAPSSSENLQKALEQAKYQEFKKYYLEIKKLQMQNKSFQPEYRKEIDQTYLQSFIKGLPFVLTNGQQECVDYYVHRLQSECKVQGLIQGDVGSGKTIVAITLIAAVVQSGQQAVIMAPTEILANQLYESVKHYLAEYTPVLLTSKQRKNDKVRIKEYISLAVSKVVVGTHALLEDDVSFADLGLVIIDEQQRFGVDQRQKLEAKGSYPDVIYMSATPIPRTLAQSIFNVLDVFKIEEKPAGRKEIETLLYDKSSKLAMMEVFEQHLHEGNQAYVVVPNISEVELQQHLSNLEDVYKSFVKRYENKYQIGAVHGKVKDKEVAMEKFRQKEYQILIATSVVEVGVDVAGATCIMILNAERFGMSTLHQLRGRVGRNDLPAACLLYNGTNNEESLQRLKALTLEADGYNLALHDLQKRGGGEMFGIRQAGSPDFKVFNINSDFDIMQQVIDDLN